MKILTLQMLQPDTVSFLSKQNKNNRADVQSHQFGSAHKVDA